MFWINRKCGFTTCWKRMERRIASTKWNWFGSWLARGLSRRLNEACASSCIFVATYRSSATNFFYHDCLESMVWEEIDCKSLILCIVIRIQFSPFDLACVFSSFSRAAFSRFGNRRRQFLVVKERCIARQGGRRSQGTPIPLPHEASFTELGVRSDRTQDTEARDKAGSQIPKLAPWRAGEPRGALPRITCDVAISGQLSEEYRGLFRKNTDYPSTAATFMRSIGTKRP